MRPRSAGLNALSRSGRSNSASFSGSASYPGRRSTHDRVGADVGVSRMIVFFKFTRCRGESQQSPCRRT